MLSPSRDGKSTVHLFLAPYVDAWIVFITQINCNFTYAWPGINAERAEASLNRGPASASPLAAPGLFAVLQYLDVHRSVPSLTLVGCMLTRNQAIETVGIQPSKSQFAQSSSTRSPLTHT